MKFISRLLLVTLLTNVAFAYRPEASVWDDRRKSAEIQLASLPANLLAQYPNPLLRHPGESRDPGFKHFVESKVGNLDPGFRREDGPASQLPPSFFPHVNIRDSFVGAQHAEPSPRPTVVILEDVHLNKEAQGHLSSAIKSFGDLKGSSPVLIGLEGGEGNLFYDEWKSQGDRDVATGVADAFFEKGRISGPAHAGFTSYQQPGARGLSFLGVDQMDLHSANVQAYRDSKELKPRVVEELAKLTGENKQGKEKFFSPELKNFDAQVQKYRAGQLGLSDYVVILASFVTPAKAGAQVVNNFQKNVESLGPGFRRDDVTGVSFNIQLFLEAYLMEKSFDFTVVEQQRKEVLERLVKTLNEKDLSSLVELSLAYEQGIITFAGYYAQLKKVCQVHGIDLRTTPQFDKYIQYVLLTDGIKTEPLFKEITELEKSVYAYLATTDAQRLLIFEDRRLFLTNQLVEFGMTSDQWDEYKSFVTPAEAGAQVLNNFLKPFKDFYTLADRRSQKMVENLGPGLRRDDGLTVLVVGGFHTAGVTQQLKQRGISYVVASPKITKLDISEDSHFLSVFDREKTPLEKIFSGQKLFLADRLRLGSDLEMKSFNEVTKLSVHSAQHTAEIKFESVAGKVDLKASPEETEDSLKIEVGQDSVFVTAEVDRWLQLQARLKVWTKKFSSLLTDGSSSSLAEVVLIVLGGIFGFGLSGMVQPTNPEQPKPQKLSFRDYILDRDARGHSAEDLFKFLMEIPIKLSAGPKGFNEFPQQTVIGGRYKHGNALVDIQLVLNKTSKKFQIVLASNDGKLPALLKSIFMTRLDSLPAVLPDQPNPPLKRIALGLLLASLTYWMASPLVFPSVNLGLSATIPASPLLLSVGAFTVSMFLPRGIRRKELGKVSLFRVFNSSGKEQNALFLQDFDKRRLKLPKEKSDHVNLLSLLSGVDALDHRKTAVEHVYARARIIERFENCAVGRWARMKWPVQYIILRAMVNNIYEGMYDSEIFELARGDKNNVNRTFDLLRRHGIIGARITANDFIAKLRDPKTQAAYVYRILRDLVTYLGHRALDYNLKKRGQGAGTRWVISPDADPNFPSHSTLSGLESEVLSLALRQGRFSAGISRVIPEIQAVRFGTKDESFLQLQRLMEFTAAIGVPVKVKYINTGRVLLAVILGLVEGLFIRYRAAKGKAQKKEVIENFSWTLLKIPLFHGNGHRVADLGHWFTRLRNVREVTPADTFEKTVGRDNAIVLLWIYRHIFFDEPLPNKLHQLSPQIYLKIEKAKRLLKFMKVHAAPTLLIERGPHEPGLAEQKTNSQMFRDSLKRLLEAKKYLATNFTKEHLDDFEFNLIAEAEGSILRGLAYVDRLFLAYALKTEEQLVLATVAARLSHAYEARDRDVSISLKSHYAERSIGNRDAFVFLFLVLTVVGVSTLRLGSQYKSCLVINILFILLTLYFSIKFIVQREALGRARFQVKENATRYDLISEFQDENRYPKMRTLPPLTPARVRNGLIEINIPMLAAMSSGQQRSVLKEEKNHLAYQKSRNLLKVRDRSWLSIWWEEFYVNTVMTVFGRLMTLAALSLLAFDTDHYQGVPAIAVSILFPKSFGRFFVDLFSFSRPKVRNLVELPNSTKKSLAEVQRKDIFEAIRYISPGAEPLMREWAAGEGHQEELEIAVNSIGKHNGRADEQIYLEMLRRYLDRVGERREHMTEIKISASHRLTVFSIGETGKFEKVDRDLSDLLRTITESEAVSENKNGFHHEIVVPFFREGMSENQVSVLVKFASEHKNNVQLVPMTSRDARSNGFYSYKDILYRAVDMSGGNLHLAKDFINGNPPPETAFVTVSRDPGRYVLGLELLEAYWVPIADFGPGWVSLEVRMEGVLAAGEST